MSDRSFYASTAMQVLLARELAAISSILAGVYGNYGLLLHPRDVGSVALPVHLLGACLALSVDSSQHLRGEVSCAPQALPFAGESFKLVIAQHVLEQIQDGDACAAELARVLAAEGVALIFGFNPYGTWRP